MSFAHNDTVSFRVWPVNFPHDYLTLHYVIEIAQGNAWASIDENDISYKYFFDPENRTLHFDGADENVDITIYSLTGQLVFSASNYSLVNSESIDLSKYSNEMLIVNVVGVSKQVSSFKIQVH